MVPETECNLPVSMLQAPTMELSNHLCHQNVSHLCVFLGRPIVKEAP